MHFPSSTLSAVLFSLLVTFISAAPADVQLGSVQLERRSLAATGHAKVYGPPDGDGGEIYLDLAELPTNAHDSRCTLGVALPMHAIVCECQVVPNPFYTLISCYSRMVRNKNIPEPWGLDSVTLTWTGSYYFSSAGLQMNAKLSGCQPNCDGVELTV